MVSSLKLIGLLYLLSMTRAIYGGGGKILQEKMEGEESTSYSLSIALTLKV